jgi:hypothetical protein
MEVLTRHIHASEPPGTLWPQCYVGPADGLNVFANRNISFPWRESNHTVPRCCSSEPNYYWLRYPGFLQTRNPTLNSRTSADRGAVDAAFPSPPPGQTGHCPQGSTGATTELDGSSLSLSLSPNNQLKAHYIQHHTEQCAQLEEICKRGTV